jgi:MtN3 and saliva related transmembrane protein
MNAVDIVGYLASCVSVVSFLPQIVHSWKTKNTKDISLGMFCGFFIGFFLWLTYGVLINSLPIMLTNVINIGLVASILFLKKKHG